MIRIITPLITLLITLSAGITAFAVAGGKYSNTDSQPANAITFVHEKAAAQLIANGTLVIDVRSNGEWNNGHIVEALHIPFQEISQRLPTSTSVETPVLLYCKSGGRATHAAKALEALGYQQVYVLKPSGYRELQQAVDARQAR